MKPLSERPFFHLVLIAAVGLLVYSNTFNVPFQWDEHTFIAGNPIIKDLSYFLEPSKAEGLEYYGGLKNRYIGYLTFALNYRVHGLDVTGYHLFNFAVHILNSLLVYLLAVLIFKTPYLAGQGIGKHSRHIGLFAALLFVAHPVQTEAVTYIFQRLASLAAFFYLGSLVLYIKWRGSIEQDGVRGPWRLWLGPKALVYFASLLSAVLAMKTKENAFTLPMIIALAEFLLFTGPARRRLLALAPFLLTLLIIPLTLLAGVDRPLEEAVRGITGGAMYHNMTREEYFFTELRVLVTYIRLLLLPVGQNLDYDYSVYRSFFDAPVLLSFAFFISVLVITGYIFYRLRFENPALRPLVLGLLWFFIALSVESSLIVLPTLIDEYRLYLPSIGFFIGSATGVFMLFTGLKNGTARKLMASAILLVLVLFAYAAHARNDLWKTNTALWQDVVTKAPDNARGRMNLGLSYASKGQTDMAIEQFRLALALQPDYAEAHNNMGLALSGKGLHDEAIKHFRRAIILNPLFAEAHNNLGLEYEANGLLYKAVEQYQNALNIKPEFTDALNNLGLAYASQGDFQQAVAHYEKALGIDPDDVRVRYNLGLAYLSMGKKDRAKKEFSSVVEKDPSHQAKRFIEHLD